MNENSLEFRPSSAVTVSEAAASTVDWEFSSSRAIGGRAKSSTLSSSALWATWMEPHQNFASYSYSAILIHEVGFTQPPPDNFALLDTW